MKRILIIIFSAAALFALTAAQTSAQDELVKVRFMPGWTAQSQFIGYYVAREKGFYQDAGLDVSIIHLPANAKLTAIDYLTAGDVDICMTQLLLGLITKGHGSDILAVLQTSQNSGLMCVSHEPIKTLQDLDGMKIGRWISASSEPADFFCMDNGLNVHWVYFLHGINLYVSHAIDATLCYSYSEYLELLFAEGTIPPDRVNRFSKLGYNYPEDAVFVKRDYYNSHREVVESFKDASKKGWEYAKTHPDEALDIVMKVTKDLNIMTNRTFQKMMMDEVFNLQINPETGVADYAPVSVDIFNAMIDDLLKTGYISEPILYQDIIK